MSHDSEIFEKYYNDYCNRIAEIDFALIKDKIGVEHDGDQMVIRFFSSDYIISGKGISDASGRRPDYMICVILAKYILLCPDQFHRYTEWVSFKDFKRTSHFTNVNYFSSDTEQVILKHFSGKLDDLADASEKMGGFRPEVDMAYDLSMQFDVLPRISLLLLFNDSDEEFPAQCTVLFQKHAEYYLDPESLAMTSAILAKRLQETSQDF
ncbi:hypothetical protein DENIS_0418 [Desulfonema ishimotonii]|uniref:DUF3786 domain-containing protein n=1 Tax=Desulfonema ishimotonii TaxID=45657 RepID=A0A401FR88_9BACT|nr:DUF3786 domain-containing protein [Desulfonema ishimotonii]GBC59479.1 hypothetical protein DENIS_0418 [Desulfonema ishimotonii]